jgi:hypothetical protein
VADTTKVKTCPTGQILKGGKCIPGIRKKAKKAKADTSKGKSDYQIAREAVDRYYKTKKELGLSDISDKSISMLKIVKKKK